MVSLGPLLAPVAALAAVAVPAHLALRLHGRRAARSAAPTRRFRRALGVGLPAVAVAAVVALLATDAPALLAGGLAAVSPALAASAVGAVLVRFAAGLGVVAAVVTAYFGAFPHVRAARDLEMDAGRTLRRVVRYLVVMLAVLVVGLQAYLALEASLGPVAAVLAFLVGTLALALLGSPWLLMAVRSTREPGPAERDRLAGVCEAAGLSPDRVRIVEAGDEQVALALVRGPPGRRYLFATDYLLDSLDDDRAAALVAVAAARGLAVPAYRLSVPVLVAVALALELGPGGGTALASAAGLPALAAVPGYLAALAALLLGGEALVLRADRAAARRVGPATVAGALRRVADLHDAGLAGGRVAGLLRMRPSAGRRLDRLARLDRDGGG